MLIFLAALQAIPHDLYEAARIDGASGFQIAMKIKLPNVRAAALLAMLLSIVGTIQLFKRAAGDVDFRSEHFQVVHANDDGPQYLAGHADPRVVTDLHPLWPSLWH